MKQYAFILLLLLLAPLVFAETTCFENPDESFIIVNPAQGNSGGTSGGTTPVSNQSIVPSNLTGIGNETTLGPQATPSNIFKVTDKKVWIIGIIVMGVLLLGMIIALSEYVIQNARRKSNVARNRQGRAAEF